MRALSHRGHFGWGVAVRVRKACLQLLQAQKKNRDLTIVGFILLFVFIVRPQDGDVVGGATFRLAA